MRAVIQRVESAQVTVGAQIYGEIGKGLLILLGVAASDEERDAIYLAEKTLGLRVFDDDADKMNLSVTDIEGEILVVSQFTLFGDVRRGKRPSYSEAAAPVRADELYRFYVEKLRESLRRVETGKFQAMMKVSLVNDGPVTILLDSTKLF